MIFVGELAFGQWLKGHIYKKPAAIQEHSVAVIYRLTAACGN